MFHNHKFKCLRCGLHFAVFSDYLDWPVGTVGEAGPAPFCPECGGNWAFLRFYESDEGFIFMAMPGKAAPLGIGGAEVKPSEMQEQIMRHKELQEGKEDHERE